MKVVLQTFKLLLPALFPSWRFFDTIAPSPRIEFTVLKTAQDKPENWAEFRPRPDSLSIKMMFKRMFYNPRWNESLFLVSCSERLMDNPTDHSIKEITKRIETEFEASFVVVPYWQFRLVFVSRQGGALEKQISFVSPVYCYSESAGS